MHMQSLIVLRSEIDRISQEKVLNKLRREIER